MRRSTDWDWNELGRRQAFGAILTGPGGELKAWNASQFFETGRQDVERLLADADSLVPGLRRGRALDFGCGVGRVTRPLAGCFQEVVGIDVAESMVAKARELNADCARCRFEVNRAEGLPGLVTGSFDLVYSRLVLQHIPPDRVATYIPEFVRVLAPAGLLFFQLPAPLRISARARYAHAPVADTRLKKQLPRWVVVAYRHLKFPFVPHMRMFGMPREQVLDLLGGAGARVLAVRPDNSHGPEGEGFEYWATKP